MLGVTKERTDMTVNPQDLKAIIIQMQKLEDAVKQCAPAPDNPTQCGFIYAKSDSRTAGDRESLLGSIVADHVLGCGFGFMSQDLVGGLDAGHLIEAYDEFQVERNQAKQNKARAALNSFNAARLGSKYKARELAFEKDLPKRVKLEHAYIRLSRNLDELESVLEMKPDLKRDLDLDRKMDMVA